MFVYKIWIYVVRNLYKMFNCFLKIIRKRYFSNSFYHYSWRFQLYLFIIVQTVDMNRLIFQNSSFLKTMCNATRFHRNLMIQFNTTDQVLALSEIARKVIRRRVHISNSPKEKLSPYKCKNTWHTLNSIQYGKNEYYVISLIWLHYSFNPFYVYWTMNKDEWLKVTWRWQYIKAYSIS